MSDPKDLLFQLPCVVCEQPMKSLGYQIWWAGDSEYTKFKFECPNACQTTAEVHYQQFIPVDIAAQQVFMRSPCALKAAETDEDRAAGKWEPGQGLGRPIDPKARVRFCTKFQDHTGEHAHVREDHPEYWEKRDLT